MSLRELLLVLYLAIVLVNHPLLIHLAIVAEKILSDSRINLFLFTQLFHEFHSIHRVLAHTNPLVYIFQELFKLIV